MIEEEFEMFIFKVCKARAPPKTLFKTVLSDFLSTPFFFPSHAETILFFVISTVFLPESSPNYTWSARLDLSSSKCKCKSLKNAHIGIGTAKRSDLRASARVVLFV